MRRILKLIILITVQAYILTGCSVGDNETNKDDVDDFADSSKILIVADTLGPTSLDMADNWNSWYTSRWGITETLFKLDKDLKPYPFLAESCEMIDKYTWVIKIRENIYFHNNNKLTAESIKLCWERTAKLNVRFKELLDIDMIETNGQILTIRTATVTPTIMNILSEPLTGIIDVTAQDDPSILPVGTGPFKAIRYDVKTKAVLEKYSNYWKGKPKLDGAIINIIGDTSTLSLAQQNNESHVSISMPATSLELFADRSLYKIDEAPGSRGQVIFINFQNELLRENAVREAISMIIDKESYANIVNKGASSPSKGLYPDFMPYEVSERYEFNLTEANNTLNKSGFVDTDGDGIREIAGDNISIRLLTYSAKAELPKICSGIASSAKKVGLDIQVEVHESVSKQQRSKDFDLMLVSFAMVPTGDPSYFANLAFKTNGSCNYGGYSNNKVDLLIKQLNQEFDNEKRIELTEQIQQLVLDDVGFIVIGHSKYNYVMSSKVKALDVNPSEYYLLDNEVYIEN